MRNSAHPEILRGRCLVGLDDDVVSLSWVCVSRIHFEGSMAFLTHRNVQNSCLVGRDWDKVVCDDRQDVIVDRELEVGVARSVHKAKPVRCSLGERCIKASTSLVGCTIRSKYVGSVNQSVVKCGRTIFLGSGEQLIHSVDIPIVHNYNTLVLVVVRTGRTMNHNAAE